MCHDFLRNRPLDGSRRPKAQPCSLITCSCSFISVHSSLQLPHVPGCSPAIWPPYLRISFMQIRQFLSMMRARACFIRRAPRCSSVLLLPFCAIENGPQSGENQPSRGRFSLMIAKTLLSPFRLVRSQPLYKPHLSAVPPFLITVSAKRLSMGVHTSKRSSRSTSLLMSFARLLSMPVASFLRLDPQRAEKLAVQTSRGRLCLLCVLQVACPSRSSARPYTSGRPAIPTP